MELKNTHSGYYGNNIISFLTERNNRKPCNLLEDNIGTNYGFKKDGVVGRIYTLISRNDNEVKIHGGDTQIIFSYNIHNQPKEIKDFNNNCYRLIESKTK